MTAFIRQEALEKAKEIQFKADEVIMHSRHWPQAHLTCTIGIRNRKVEAGSPGDIRH